MRIEFVEREAKAPTDREDTAKRRQIMNGAREVFLAMGFDGASMGEIARKAGVSKGTLYVYFTSKEQLFEAITHEECKAQVEGVFAFDSDDHDVEAALTRLGRSYIKFLCRPGAMSPIRTVISISDRMPEIGRQFYESGPMQGIVTLRRYLENEVAAGTLVIDDCEVAASQFLDSCRSTTFFPLIFNAAHPPTDERIAYVVGIAVRTFLAAYARTGRPASG
jgi:AcrR family transcriptional regulator